MSRPVDIATLAGMLNDRIGELVAKLLPAGTQEGAEWVIGSVAGEPGRSMRVRLRGATRGIWCDFNGAPQHRGDALELVAQVAFGGDKRRALAWSRAWLGIDQVDPDTMAKVHQQRRLDKKREGDKEEKRMRGIAQHFYLEAAPSLVGTWSYDYLRQRGIDLLQLGRQPRALRHHYGLMHPETGEIVPAMVAAISGEHGFCGTHRTYLERRRDGAIVNLSGVKDKKLSIRSYGGGCIHLWRGATRKPFRDAEAGEWITVSEGIEDGLTGALAKPEQRVVCAVSLSNMGGLWLPAAIEGVVILAQNGDGPQAQAALERAIKHFHDTGKRVKLARPPAEVKDVNDMVRA